jgi:putative salt-induced outer membrane protein YdiY
MVVRTEKSRYTVVGELDREEKTNKKRDGGDGRSHRSEDSTFGSFKYDYFFAEKWYLYNAAAAKSDDMAEIDLRTAFGVGLGHQFFDTEETKLSLEAGPAYVSTNYDDDDDEDYGAGRWAVKFEQRLFENVVTLFHNHEGLMSFEETKDTFLRSRTGFRIPTYHKVHLTLQYNFDWEKNPAENSTGTDTKLVYKIGYEW